MKLKDRIKTYNFWVSLSSAVFLILKVLGNQFGFNVNENLFSDIVTSLCGILVILGIIVPPTTKISNQLKQSVLEEPSLEISKDNLTENSKPEISENVLDVNLNTSQTEECDINLNDAPCDVILNDVKNNNSDERQLIEDVTNDVEVKNQMENNISISENIAIENNNHNDEQKQKVAELLAAQKNLFEGNISDYIELLQNQINLLQEK